VDDERVAEDPDGIDALIAELTATDPALELMALFGIAPVENPCGYCGREIPDGRRGYCSDRHAKTVRMRRWRARRANEG
jgi:hypothetical protein